MIAEQVSDRNARGASPCFATSSPVSVADRGHHLEASPPRGVGGSRCWKGSRTGSFSPVPAIYTVNSTGNGTSGTGDSGTLPYLIGQANANTSTAGSLIQFDPTVFTPSFGGVITLSSSLELSEKDGPEVIEGTVLTNPPPRPLASAGVSIVGNSGFTAFTVDTGVTACFSGLSITARQ